jgi:hypothetical protein
MCYVKFTRKELALAALAIVLLAVYVIYFTDWFKTKTVQISHTLRHTRQADRLARSTGVVITFGLDRTVRLTEVEVYSVVQLQTNRHAVPLWHLVSDSNSVPVRTFVYGQNLRGMRPFIPGLHPHPLDTNQIYRLLVAAGKIKGQHDFRLTSANPTAK